MKKIISSALIVILAIFGLVAPAQATATRVILTSGDGLCCGEAFAVTSGTPFTLRVAIADGGANVVTSATNVINRSAYTGTGSLSGALALTAVSGRATFSDLVITGSGAHTITFSSEGLIPVTSAVITVNPAPSSDGGGGGATAPVVVAPVVPVVAPGARVSGTKWSVLTGADGITRARVSVGTQFRGKNAVFFKGLRNGKLVRVGTGKVGKAGRANLQTRVKFREGQKIRVQVDGRFRSTITITN